MARITTSRRTGSSSSNYVECYVDYTTSTSNTAVTISVTQMSLHHTIGWKASFTYSYWTSGTLQSGDSHISASTSVTNKQYTGNGTTKVLGGQSKSFKRTTSAYTITLHGRMRTHDTNYDGSANITIPALPSYAVNYNGNGATGGSTAGQTKWYGINLALRANGFTRPGYTFWHWNTASNNTGTTYNEGATYTGNAALNPLYAIWNPIIYFNDNGGSGGPVSQSKVYGTNLTLSATIPTRQGYEFINWNTASDGSGTSYTPSSIYTANTTVTLYAQWKPKPPVKVKRNNAWANGTPFVKINNIWKTINSIYIKVGTEWKQTVDNKTNKNLLLGTKMDDRSTFVANSDTDFSKPLRWYNGSASIHNFQLIADGIYKDTVTLNSASNLGIAFARLASDINLDPNEYYTLSCYASCSKSGAHLDIGLSYYTTANAWVWMGGTNPEYFRALNTVQRFALTFKPNADTKAIMYCFTVVGANGGKDTFTIYNCKLEKGRSATDWSPAIEEL